MITSHLRSSLRAYITKFPFIRFSAFKSVESHTTTICTLEKFKLWMDENVLYNKAWKTKWENFAADYEWIDDIPKGFLQVKLNPEISDFDHEWVVNGIRGYLSKKDVSFSLKEVSLALESLEIVFFLFVTVVAAIAFVIVFFMLLISTTQNINEAIWEYGVLRSMGITKSEGLRVYLYESYSVVIIASALGLLVGLAASILVSAQLLTFIESPSKLIFPIYTFTGMIVVSFVTTYIAVYLPMSKVNQK
mmetsp:Transcript_32128/g.42598  ORF Transcript_32128/g.42598 Transcript_32128/m.42598 type:complete len:248 (+) Transcript_32128:262-1005(+)